MPHVPVHDFSLFEGDPLNRLFAYIGLRSTGFLNLVSRFAILFFVTALPTALLAWANGFGPGQERPLNFFGDVAAWGQALLGYPLFIYAEWVISKKTRSCAHHFSTSGVIRDDDLPKLESLHRRVYNLRTRLLPDVLLFVLGFLFAMMWLYGETHNAYNTWHALGAPAVQTPTRPGLWVAFVGIPIFNYWWLRWVWKIGMWCWYLYKVSRLNLALVASHPDLTGGIGFVSETQTSFAIVIFAFGIGIVAPLVGYKLEIEHASLFSFSVGGPLLGFILGAPALFTLPLLMFTKRLGRTKERAVEAFQDRATSAARNLERKFLKECSPDDDDCEIKLGAYMSAVKNLHAGLEHIHLMRVVPFDIRSASQLIASTIGSLLPLLSKVTEIPDSLLTGLELLKKLLGGD